MKRPLLKSESLLLLTAAIWGFAFIAQRTGMKHIGPFTFNAIRFAMGSLVLTPLIWHRQRHSTTGRHQKLQKPAHFLSPVLAGLALFLGASLQQWGVVYTTAGKAGFITGLYVIIVPILGLFWGQRIRWGTWIGAILATIGMYLLSFSGRLTVNTGDLLVLGSAFFWAIHVHIVGWLTSRMDSIKLACIQFAVCSGLSFMGAFILETIIWDNILLAGVPILYAGLMSTGIAYTLQVVGQKDVPSSNAAIIMSLEAVFAVLGGWLFLQEIIPLKGLIGCTIMFAGMLLAQLFGSREKK